MPSSCCIPKCNNTTKNGFHLFRFPLNRPEILKMWINAIGKNFNPTKSHLICSAHFIATDLMERPNASGVRLKNLAVPSVFFEAPVPASTIITPVPTPVPVPVPVPTFLASIPNTEPASTASDTIKMTMRKPRKVMDSSFLSFKMQEMSPRKKKMWRTIKSLKQKLTRKEEKINSLENLLKNLRYKKL
ncbi:unnamed protein product [Lasius platythorax]|uniref:THAP-type domain-containing protein n=1 Tax=Lasius platythorax TaxID=488582 RepID=A0AAV2P234_9HYME